MEPGRALPARIGDKYVLVERIGAGGVGVVYRAEQPPLSRSVAVKLLHRSLLGNPEAVERFHAEAFAATRFAHPNTVMVLDHGTADDGTPYIVMEHVLGESLRAVLRRETWLPVARVIEIARQLLAGLGEAHRAGVVHADVKTDNILVEPTRDGGVRIKLVDFGLAEVAGDVAGAVPAIRRCEWTVAGTPEYLAPEVIRGELATPLADLYGVGVVIYELLTGATPFGCGHATDVMTRHLNDEVVLPSLRRPDRSLPSELEAVVMRALAKQPAARFQDACAFADALARVPVRPITEAARCESCGASGTAERRFCTACGTAAGDVAPSAGADVITKVMPSRAFADGSTRIAARTVGSEARRLRSDVGAAIVKGDVPQIAAGYLALARVFAARQRLDEAIRELEEGLDVLTVGGAAQRAGSADVCRLTMMLATLEANRLRAGRTPR